MADSDAELSPISLLFGEILAFFLNLCWKETLMTIYAKQPAEVAELRRKQPKSLSIFGKK